MEWKLGWSTCPWSTGKRSGEAALMTEEDKRVPNSGERKGRWKRNLVFTLTEGTKLHKHESPVSNKQPMRQLDLRAEV